MPMKAARKGDSLRCIISMDDDWMAMIASH